MKKLIETLELIRIGDKIDQQKLTDMKFEGKYATKVVNPVSLIATTSSSMPTSSFIQNRTIPRRYYYWQTISTEGISRCKANKNSEYVYQAMAQQSNYVVCDWIQSNSDQIQLKHLIAASSVGRQAIVETILECQCCPDINSSRFSYNAVDLAILFGYWKTYDVLVKAGGEPSADGQSLLQTCISKKYFNLATRLVRDGFATITDDMEDSAPNTEGIEWLSQNTRKEVSMDVAIRKGMLEHVIKQIDKTDRISFASFTEIFSKPTSSHIQIVDLLLEKNKADPNEIIKSDSDSDEITWPLFIASQNGATDMVQILLKYQTPTTINSPNKKGTTALWIASCNKHIDIVLSLL